MTTPSAEDYKGVVGHFATGVVVVTAQAPDGLAGFTCQTFGSLSLEPRLVSFSANTASQSWPRARRAPTLGINILSVAQVGLARVFATSGVDKFDGVAWSPGPSGAPFLEGALAHFEGRITSVATHGDHDLVVVSIECSRVHHGEPLVYYRGGFSHLA